MLPLTSLIGVASLANDRGPAERSVTTFTLVQRQNALCFSASQNVVHGP
jgi:hypothetical protein